MNIFSTDKWKVIPKDGESRTWKNINETAAENLIRLAVKIVQETRDDFWTQVADKTGRPRPLVAASAGPYGAYLADRFSGDFGRLDSSMTGAIRRRLLTDSGINQSLQESAILHR